MQIFVMPPYLEEALFAYPVLMHYLESLYIMDRDYKNVLVVCEDEELHDTIRASWKWMRVVSKASSQELNEAELVFEFDTN